MEKEFKLSEKKIIGGVCGGLAEYINIDPTILRVIFVVGLFYLPFIIEFYLIVWIIGALS